MPHTTEIRETLNASYSRDHWQTLLTTLFPDGSLSLLRQPEILTASHEKVTATCQLGAVTLPADDEKIALLEITTTDQVHLARNRVSLRNFVASFIDQANASAVLAVFQQPNSSDWRLTFAAKKTTLDQDTFEITTVETAPRRFTFLLGENESCKTAAARLNQLVEKQHDLNLADLEGAFSVESLTKDFFKKYKEHYHTFIKDLFSAEKVAATRELFEITEEDDDYEKGKANKPVRDFVKTLLGRLVFLTFLQKKGWLGCPASSKQWKGGDPNFLQSYLKQARHADEDDIFHSKYLTDLFFDALNNDERKNDIFSLTNSRLPYLNGGLFDDADDHARSVDFPPLLFQNLLNFFDEYNFTIDENDPEDHEVGIDPEMLGMIFENLLEDNKEKGTYYTPKAIVSYMARQSLLHYLQTHLGENQALEELLNKKDSENLPEFVNQHKEEIVNLLEKVTICDPAIGSGAFPIGLLHEILWTRLTLEPEKNNSKDRAELKRSIIQNSIHGVDLDPGAIEIARLRFWLALVVDEDKPRPLPNLDYKIHRADSLIEYIRGEAVNLGTETPTDTDTKNAVNQLIQAKQDLFIAQGLPGKRKAWFQLYRALSQLAQAEFTWMRNDTNFADADRIHQLDQNAKAFGQWISKIDSIQNQKVLPQERLLSELRQWFDDPNHPTFLWKLHFGGIFADGGFDIVIANPPYGSELSDTNKKHLKQHFSKWIQRIPNSFVYFTGLASQIAKNNGVTTLIIPNELFFQIYMENARIQLINHHQLLHVINLGDGIFDGVTVPSGIVIFRKSPNKTPLRLADLRNIKKRDLQHELNNQPHPKHFPDIFHKIPNTTVSFDLNSLPLLEKLTANSRNLEEFCSTIEYGACTACDAVYFLPLDKVEKLFLESDRLKPCLRGSDIQKFSIAAPNHKLLYITKDSDYSNLQHTTSYLNSNRDKLISSSVEKRQGKRRWDILFRSRKPNIFNSPKLVFRQTGDSVVCALDIADNYYAINSVHVAPLKENSNENIGHFLNAVLNSRSVNFFYRAVSQEAGRALAEVKPARLKKLPIPNATEAEKAKLSTLAQHSATAAAIDDQASLAVHEAEINQIVYRLFDLTEAEINLIETSLGIETATITPVIEFTGSKLPSGRRPAALSSALNYLREFIPQVFKVSGESISLEQLFSHYYTLCNLEDNKATAREVIGANATKWVKSFSEKIDSKDFIEAFRSLVSADDIQVSSQTGLLTWSGDTYGVTNNPWINCDARFASQLFANAPEKLVQPTQDIQRTIITPLKQTYKIA